MPRCRRYRAFALALLVTAAAACKEGSGVKVTGFRLNGVHAVSQGQLRSVLATGKSSRLPWGEKRYFSREEFEADLKRIEAFYKDRGYPDARVTSFDAKLSGDQSSVDVTINISEGEPLRVERITIEGLAGLPEQHQRELETRLPLKEGQPLDRALLQASREAAVDELKDHGYPYAMVQVLEDAGSADRQRVITLRGQPGPLAHFGPTEITGNSSVSDRVVRRQLGFRPGELYQQSKVVDSQRDLYRLELFQFANVQAQHTEEKATEIPTRVTVTEGKHRRINLGLGYGSEEDARAQIDWRHVNFFGGARTAGVLGRYSGIDRGVKLNFGEPYFLTRRFTLGLTGQYWNSREPAYHLTTLGGRATVARRFGRGIRPVLTSSAETTLSFTYTNELEDYTISNETLTDLTQRDELIALGLDPRCGTGSRCGIGAGQLSSWSIDAGRNTTGNLLDAKRGYMATVHLEQAGRWLKGDFDFAELTLEARYFQTVAGRAVIAVRARGGSIDGIGIEQFSVPFFKRYFLGGATNLRGWGRFEVSPLSLAGLPIGGQSVLNFSTEVRVPLAGKLSGVLFVDAGNVWRQPWDFNLNDLHYDAGPGLRYDTPIGPIRIDVGFQLDRIEGLLVNGKEQARPFRIHFSIGQAF
jgi:outer membrane protein insertion porin family